MAAGSIFESFLASQGYALFERVDEGAFRPIGAYPDWCVRIWGARPEVATKVPPLKLLRLADAAPFLEHFLVDAAEFWHSHAAGCLQSGNWIERASDGSEIPLEAVAVSLGDKSLLVVQNLSRTFPEQQQLYQTARDSLLEHERLVSEIQKKEILLHCIIHDLTQPLTAMTGCFDLLSAEKLPARVVSFVKIGHRESQRQEQMIRGILEAFSADLSAARTAVGKAHEEPDVAACAAQAVQDLSAAFAAHGVHLRLDPRLDSQHNALLNWKVAGDASRIRRIFGNLLENAMRYTPRAKSVTVGVEDKGASVLAFVDDEGPGLPPEDADGGSAGKLFALFARGKDRPGKAGLGLYFCKVTVERWGGAIGAENRPEGGSRFWFRLPRAIGNTPRESSVEKTVAATQPQDDAVARRSSAAAAGKSSDAQAAAERSAQPMRILIAEDNEANRELMSELLKTRGHSVSEVGDGREALAALKRESFDVLLMDEEMPHMSGIEAARAIRGAEAVSGKHLVIIGITGNSTDDDEKRLLDAGMDAFLPKPVRMETLFRAVESRGNRPAAAVSDETVISASAAPSEDAVAHLHRTTGGNEALMRSLAKTFLADAPSKFSGLRHAIAKKDADALAKAAHALKGALGIFGAPDAVALARTLESKGRAGTVDGAAEIFGSLEATFAGLGRQLQALQPGPKPKSKPTAKQSVRPSRKSKAAKRKR